MVQNVNTTQVAWTFADPGVYTVQFDLSELCVGSTRLTCDSFAEVTLSVDFPAAG